jgi:hypothetical protein
MPKIKKSFSKQILSSFLVMGSISCSTVAFAQYYVGNPRVDNPWKRSSEDLTNATHEGWGMKGFINQIESYAFRRDCKDIKGQFSSVVLEKNEASFGVDPSNPLPDELRTALLVRPGFLNHYYHAEGRGAQNAISVFDKTQARVTNQMLSSLSEECRNLVEPNASAMKIALPITLAYLLTEQPDETVVYWGADESSLMVAVQYHNHELKKTYVVMLRYFLKNHGRYGTL